MNTLRKPFQCSQEVYLKTTRSVAQFKSGTFWDHNPKIAEHFGIMIPKKYPFFLCIRLLWQESDKIRQYNGEIYIKFAITVENFTDGLYPTRITTSNS